MTADDAVKLHVHIAITAVVRQRIGFITHLMYYALIFGDFRSLSGVDDKGNVDLPNSQFWLHAKKARSCGDNMDIRMPGMDDLAHEVMRFNQNEEETA